MEPPPPPGDPANSAILRAEFGPRWRWWSWFRQQWTGLSLTTVGSLVLVVLGVLAWAWNLNTHVTILETRVEPVLVEGKAEADNRLLIDNLDYRVGRIEGVLDVEYAEQLREWAKLARAARARGLPPPPVPVPKERK
jgi:hypothetical protein